MAGWKKNTKNELVKLNNYSKTDITNAEIPVVIPDAGKNARFKVTDLAPVYKDDEDNCLKIENGVISKTDTKYQSGDDVIKVNTVGNENIISCDGFGGKKYVAGATIQVTENTNTNTTTFSTLKSTSDKLMGNIQTYQNINLLTEKIVKQNFLVLLIYMVLLETHGGQNQHQIHIQQLLELLTAEFIVIIAKYKKKHII